MIAGLSQRLLWMLRLGIRWLERVLWLEKERELMQDYHGDEMSLFGACRKVCGAGAYFVLALSHVP